MFAKELLALAALTATFLAMLLAGILGAVPANVSPQGAWLDGKQASGVWALAAASTLLGTIVGGTWTTALASGHGKVLAVVTQPVCGLLLAISVVVLAADGARVAEAVTAATVLALDMVWIARARRRFASAGAHLQTLGIGLASNKFLRPITAACVLATAAAVFVSLAAAMAALRGGGSPGGVALGVVVVAVSFRWMASFVRTVPSVAVAGSFLEHLARLAAAEGSVLRVTASAGLIGAGGGSTGGGEEGVVESGRAGAAVSSGDAAGGTEPETGEDAGGTAGGADGAVAAAAAPSDGDSIDLEGLVAGGGAVPGADSDSDGAEEELPVALRRGPRRRCVDAVTARAATAAYAAALAIPGPLLWPLQGCLARRSPAVRRAARAGHPLPLAQLAVSAQGWDGARAALWGVVDARGADAAVDDDMTPRLLFLAASASGLLVALITGSLSSGPIWGIRAAASMLPAAAAAAACLCPVEAAAATLLATFATAPAAVAAANPLVFHRLSRLSEARRVAKGK